VIAFVGMFVAVGLAVMSVLMGVAGFAAFAVRVLVAAVFV